MKINPVDQLKPVIEMNEPNDSINLGSFDIVLDIENKIHETCNGKLTYSFAPNPRLLCEIAIDDKKLLGIKIFNHDCIVNLNGNKITMMCRNSTINKVILTPRREPVQIVHKKGKVKYAIFHVFNFISFYGTDFFFVQDGTMEKRLNSITLESDDWVVTISDMIDSSERIKSLRTKGGYALTHVGKLEKKDGTSFGVNECDDILFSLYHFLSFAVGRWMSLGFSNGFNDQSEKVWEEWGLRHCNPKISQTAWLDDAHAGVLSDIYPKFITLWNDVLWRDVIRDSIYWYLNANDGSSGIDKGIVVAQIALEKLAWHYLINYRKALTEKGFHDLRASDRIRLLCSYLEIPHEIPDIFRTIKSKRDDEWWDLSWAITDVRNSLVHPKVNSKMDFKDTYLEVWQLSLWLLEMVLLRLLNFKGSYSNRLVEGKWVGQVESPPWV